MQLVAALSFSVLASLTAVYFSDELTLVLVLVTLTMLAIVEPSHRLPWLGVTSVLILYRGCAASGESATGTRE